MEKLEMEFGGGAVVGDPFSLLIRSRTANIMVDCGLGHGDNGGSKGRSVFPPILERLNGTPLHGALVTHGHLDHGGALPHLANKNCGRVYLSEPAFDFCKMHWLDSMRIAIRKWCADQRMSVKDFYEKAVGMSLESFSWKLVSVLAEEEGAGLPFSNADIDLIVKKIITVTAGKKFMIEKTIVDPVNAGHILGALGYKIKMDGWRIFTSGDFSMKDTNYGLFPPLDPGAIGPVDILVVNATYAGVTLETLESEKAKFLADVEEAIKKGRSILIPVFAIDRATKIYSVLREAKLERYVSIFGQAQKGFSIYHKHTKGFWGANRSFCRPEEITAAPKGPVIYMATSGMMMKRTFSHVLAGKAIPKRDILIKLVGHMASGTPGGRLLEAAEAGAKTIRWNNDTELPLRADVKSYQFSAHARSSEIAALIRALEPKYVVFAHTQPDRLGKFLQENPALPGKKIIPRNGEPIIFEK